MTREDNRCGAHHQGHQCILKAGHHARGRYDHQFEPNALVTDEHRKLYMSLVANSLPEILQKIANHDRDVEARAVAGAIKRLEDGCPGQFAALSQELKQTIALAIRLYSQQARADAHEEAAEIADEMCDVDSIGKAIRALTTALENPQGDTR